MDNNGRIWTAVVGRHLELQFLEKYLELSGQKLISLSQVFRTNQTQLLEEFFLYLKSHCC
ncbi:MAG: hypothetical protein ACFFBD_12125 [Candidatus Hodarchaeota archaeon]